MNQEKQRKLEGLADCIDNLTVNVEGLRFAALEVVRALKEVDEAAYLDAGKVFETRVQTFQATNNKIMGDCSRFSKAVVKEAVALGILKEPKQPEKNTEDDPLDTKIDQLDLLVSAIRKELAKKADAQPNTTAPEIKGDTCPECKAEAESKE